MHVNIPDFSQLDDEELRVFVADAEYSVTMWDALLHRARQEAANRRRIARGKRVTKTAQDRARGSRTH